MFNPAMVSVSVLNVSTWKYHCNDASHYYGTLVLVSDPIATIDNISGIKILGQSIEMRKLKTEHDRFKKLRQRSTNQFDSFSELKSLAIEELQKLRVVSDLIILENNEITKNTEIVRKEELNINLGYSIHSPVTVLVDGINSYEEAVDTWCLQKIPSMIRLETSHSNSCIYNYPKIFDYLSEL